ncbi:MAG: septum formation family protein [Sciscionella sp.]
MPGPASPSVRRLLRRGWSWRTAPHGFGWLAGGLLAAFMLLSIWQVRDTYAGAIPTVAASPGTCHSFATREEYYNTSDVSPPVPCDRPHQSEVYALHTYTGPLAGMAQRPGLEALNKIRATACSYAGLRSYLGARPRDDLDDLQSLAVFPTPTEWADGQRGYRCEVLPTRSRRGDPPTVSFPLHDIMRTPASVQFRLCRRGQSDVPCSVPHEIEYVNAVIPGPQRGHGAGWVPQHCGGYAREFLGVAPASLGLRVLALPASGGTGAIACAVSGPGTRLSTSTLAAGLRR